MCCRGREESSFSVGSKTNPCPRLPSPEARWRTRGGSGGDPPRGSGGARAGRAGTTVGQRGQSRQWEDPPRRGGGRGRAEPAAGGRVSGLPPAPLPTLLCSASGAAPSFGSLLTGSLGLFCFFLQEQRWTRGWASCVIL